MLGADGLEDGTEGTAACEARGIDDGADIGLALGNRHRAVAGEHLPLHNRRAQQPLGVRPTRQPPMISGELHQHLINGSKIVISNLLVFFALIFLLLPEHKTINKN